MRLAFFNTDLSDRIDIRCTTCKGCEDEVYILTASETDIRFIFLGKERHGQLDTWHVASLLG